MKVERHPSCRSVSHSLVKHTRRRVVVGFPSIAPNATNEPDIFSQISAVYPPLTQTKGFLHGDPPCLFPFVCQFGSPSKGRRRNWRAFTREIYLASLSLCLRMEVMWRGPRIRTLNRRVTCFVLLVHVLQGFEFLKVPFEKLLKFQRRYFRRYLF
jgi:hypothetical protein